MQTYDPHAVKWHFVVEPLQILIPPVVCVWIGKIWKCCESRPDLQNMCGQLLSFEKLRKLNNTIKV